MATEALIKVKLDQTGFQKDVDASKKVLASISTGVKSDIPVAFKVNKDGLKDEVTKATAFKPDPIQLGIKLDPVQLQAISQQFGAISAKLQELKGAAVDAFKDFDTARTKLATITPEGNKLAEALKTTSAELRFQASATELANAGYTVLSGGFTNAADATKVLKAATTGAVGGFSDVDTVSKALVSTLNAYGLSANDASAVVDKFASVQQNGIITIDEYARQIAKVAPLAKQAGVSLDELNGFIATATASGVPAEQTFSGLRAAISATLKPTSEATELAKRLGISFDAQALKTKGLSGILGELRASGSDTAQNLSILFGSVEAVTALAPSAGEGFSKLSANIAASANSAGTAQQNFDKVADSLAGRFKAFQNETNAALTSLGEGVVRVTSPAVTGVTSIVRAFNSLPQPIKDVIAVALAGGAAIAATGAGIAAIATVVTPTVAGLTLLGSTFGIVTVAQSGAVVASGLLTGAWTILNSNVTLSNAQLLIYQARLVAISGGAAIASGVQGVLALSTTSVATAFTAANAAALPLVATLGVLTAAAGVTYAFYQTGQLREANESIDALSKTIDANSQAIFLAADRTKGYANRLETLKASGKSATAEQIQGAQKLTEANKIRLSQLQDELKAAQSLPTADQAQANAKASLVVQIETQKRALEGQNARLLEQLKLTKDSVGGIKAQTAATKEQIEAAKGVLTNKNKDTETGINRVQQDSKRAAEKELAKDTAVVQEQLEAKLNAQKKANTENLSRVEEAGKIRVEDTQRKIGDKLAKEKQKSEDEFNARSQSFRLSQEKQKQQFQDKLNTDQEKSDEKRRKRDEDQAKAFSGAGLAIDQAAQIGTAKPEDRAKLQSQIDEENRIREAAKQTKINPNASASELAGQAQQLAGVGQIQTEADAQKVRLALAELEKSLKAQQAEEDRKADLDRAKAKREAERAFDEEQKASALAFENQIKEEKRAFELEQETRKIQLERAQIAPIKKQVEAEVAAAREVAENKIGALKKSAEAEISALKDAAQTKQIAQDRAWEDEKIAREREFKQQERELDKANAAQIAQILGTAKQGLQPQLSNSVNPPGQQAFGNGSGLIPKIFGGDTTNNSTQKSNSIAIDKLIMQTPDPAVDIQRMYHRLGEVFGGAG
jgi:TP901 family phage tail tape measure protein